MPSSVRPACGGCRERAGANSEDADVYLPTAKGAWCLLRRRPRAVVVHPTFHSVARKQVLRMAGRRPCGYAERVAHPFSAFAAGKWQPTEYGSSTIRWHRHPSFDALQSGDSIERQFSVFSLLTSGHSLGAVPAPHHPSTQRSRAGDPDSAAHRCSASSPSGLGFQQQISRAKNTLEISCRSLRRKHISALGAGHLTSLRARVSRRQSGQIQTGEKQWHSTKTKSL